MASKLPKLASSGIKSQDSTPFFAWIRDFFLGIKRKPVTLPSGMLNEDGEMRFRVHNRFPNTQSSRSVEPALTEEGITRKIADNYYYARDARRDVTPPNSFYNGTNEAVNQSVSYASEVTGKNVGPRNNYGFDTKIPTPGFGYEWARSIENEEFTQQKDPDLARTQKFDKYMMS